MLAIIMLQVKLLLLLSSFLCCYEVELKELLPFYELMGSEKNSIFLLYNLF